MPFLVDGHNLIPKIPGITLGDPDDEMQLVQLIQEYCRIQRKRAEIYFDQAPAGWPRSRRYGMVHVNFARPGFTADGEIRRRLTKLGNTARNWTVVSSDGGVQAAGREARAQVISSEQFAQDIQQAFRAVRNKTSRDDISLSPEEIEFWLKEFNRGKGHK